MTHKISSGYKMHFAGPMLVLMIKSSETETEAEAEAAFITDALVASGGTVAESARLLGLKRTTLIEKMKRMGLVPPANEAA